MKKSGGMPPDFSIGELEQAGDLAGLVDVDLLSGGNLGQAGHPPSAAVPGNTVHRLQQAEPALCGKFPAVGFWMLPVVPSPGFRL